MVKGNKIISNPNNRLMWPAKGAFLLFIAAYLLIPFFEKTIPFGPLRLGPSELLMTNFFGFNFPVILGLILQLLLVSFFGYSLTKEFLSELDFGHTFKILASHSVGYLSICALMRLSTLFLLQSSAYLLTIIVVMLHLYVFVLRLVLRRPRPGGLPFKVASEARSMLKVIPTFVIIFIVAAIIFVKHSAFRFAGHGSLQYAYLLDNEGQYLKKLFGIYPQHYDELIFTHFLLAPVEKSFSAILPMWLNLAWLKTSVLFMLICLFKKLNVSKLNASVGVLLLMFATPSFVASKFQMIFDSNNPLFYAAHSGRIVGVIFILILLTDLFGPNPRERNKLKPLFYALTAMGLSSTSISNSLMMSVYFVLIWWLKLTMAVAEERPTGEVYIKRLLDSNIMLLFFSLPALTIPLAYHLAGLPTESFRALGDSAPFSQDLLSKLHYGLPLLIGSLPLVLVLFYGLSYFKDNFSAKIKEGFSSQHLTMKALLIFLAFTTLSLIFLGNVFIIYGPVRKILQFFNRYDPKIGPENIIDLYKLKITSHLQYFIDRRELHTGNMYCQSALSFLTCYGLTFFMVLFTILLHQAKRTKGLLVTSASSVPLTPWRCLSLFSFSLLPLLFFHMDFMRTLNEDRSWLRSRFLEIPYYTIIFTFILSLDLIREKKIRYFVLFLAVVHAVLPFYANNQLQQFLINLNTLKRNITF